MRLTNNFLLELPNRGEYAGRWDIPVNGNFELIDGILKKLKIHHASPTEPTDLDVGQAWFDTSAQRLKVRKNSGTYTLVDNENLLLILGGEPLLVKPTTLVVPSGIQINKWVDFGTVNLGTIEVSWTAQEEDESFGAFVISISKLGEFITREYFTTQPSYKFTNLVPDNVNPYIIKIKAVDKQGNATNYSEELSVMLQDNQSAPQQVGGLLVGGGINRLIVKWINVTNKDIAGYEVHVSETNMFEPDCGQILGAIPPQAIPDAPAPRTSTTMRYRGSSNPVTIGVDKQNTTYYVKVRAYNTSGHFSAFSSQAYGKTTQIDGSTDIVPLSIDSALIAEAAITDAHIANMDAGKIKTGYLDAQRLSAGSITVDKLHAGGTLKDVAQNKFCSAPNGVLTNGGPTRVTKTTVGTWETSVFPSTIMVDLTGTQDVSIDEVEEIIFGAYPSSDLTKAPASYLLDVSVDGLGWDTVVNVTNNINRVVVERFTQRPVRFAALTIRAPQENSTSVCISNLQIRSRQGGTLITGDTIDTGSITADHISATHLSAIAADLGSITAGTIDMLSSGSWIRSGQPGFNIGKGFWLGQENNIAKFSMGDAQGAGIKWDGSQLKITGGVIIGAAPDGTGGTTADEIAAGNVEVKLNIPEGLYFKNNTGSYKHVTADVYIAGKKQTTEDHNTYHYRWTIGGSVIYVDTSGSYVQLTPAAGLYPADPAMQNGLNFRTIIIDAGDVPDSSMLNISVDVSNIP